VFSHDFGTSINDGVSPSNETVKTYVFIGSSIGSDLAHWPRLRQPVIGGKQRVAPYGSSGMVQKIQKSRSIRRHLSQRKAQLCSKR
jgi:hypothetical protein